MLGSFKSDKNKGGGSSKSKRDAFANSALRDTFALKELKQQRKEQEKEDEKRMVKRQSEITIQNEHVDSHSNSRQIDAEASFQSDDLSETNSDMLPEEREEQLRQRRKAKEALARKKAAQAQSTAQVKNQSTFNRSEEVSSEYDDEDASSEVSVTEEEYQEEVEEEVTEPEEDKNDANDANDSQLSGKSKFDRIVQDSTKSVPDEYHHLFMDLDNE